MLHHLHQPRRISAISVAERVASERGERVSHQWIPDPPGGETIDRHAALFCTTGVLLRRLMGDPSCPGCSRWSTKYTKEG